MALFKRGKWWWTDFSINGQRYRQSLDTSDWREAQRLEKAKISYAQQGKLAASSQQFARLSIRAAADRYLAERLSYLAPRSITTERERLRSLDAYFTSTTLSHISADSMRGYVGSRKASGVGNRTINLELGLLRRVLK
jgi:hypothetical protein